MNNAIDKRDYMAWKVDGTLSLWPSLWNGNRVFRFTVASSRRINAVKSKLKNNKKKKKRNAMLSLVHTQCIYYV